MQRISRLFCFEDGYGTYAGFIQPDLHPLYAAIRLILALCFLVGVAVRMVGADYRALGADYSSGGFNYYVTAYEPVIGAEFRF